MYRLSLIISEIYNKYLPLAEKDGIILNLDFSDTTREISDPDRVKNFLDEHLGDTLKRSDHGEVTIGVDHEAITITDSTTTLSHAACALLSNKFIDVTSRIGFGTTVRIFFKPREAVDVSAAKPELQLDDTTFTITADRSNSTPTVEIETRLKGREKSTKHHLNFGTHLSLKGQSRTKVAKPATKSTPAKTAKITKSSNKKAVAKSKRQLAVAAKKADKEVKRIAKKATKQRQTAKKQAPNSKKPAKKTVRKLKLS